MLTLLCLFAPLCPPAAGLFLFSLSPGGSDTPDRLPARTLTPPGALFASDLLKITVGQIRHLNPGDTLPIREQKTGKGRRIR